MARQIDQTSTPDQPALVADKSTGGQAEGILGGDSVPDFIVTPGVGAIPTNVINGATGASLGAGFPFGPAFGGGVRAALGDLTGDGIADMVFGMGPGGGLVSLLNGQTIAPIGSGYPFGVGFGGGVSVAVADVNGDGFNDIVAAQATGGGAVSVFNGRNYAPIFSATPFGAGYGGGLNVAAGDLDADGRADLVVGQASGGGVAIVSGASGVVTISAAPYGAVNGLHVAAGDVNGDGRADVIIAPGSGVGTVFVFDLRTVTLLAAFVPYPGSTGGVRLAAADVTGDGRADIITVPGPGVVPTLRVIDGATFTQLRSHPALDAAFLGGAFVAAPAATGVRFTTATTATMQVGVAANVPVRAVAVPPVTTLTVAGALPSGVSFNHSGGGNGALVGTPATGTGGTYPLTFTASNGVARPQSFTLTVNEAPAITSGAATTFNTGVAGTFSITSSGFPAATIAVTGTLPTGVTFTPGATGTGTLAGTPATGTTGTYPITVTATNGIGAAATQNFVLTVQSIPTVTSAASAAFTVGAAGTFTITTAASPAVTTITATGALPAGVTLTDLGNGTATLAGTPGAGTSGAYPLVISAQNGIATGTQNFTLTVRQVPAITSAAGTTFVRGTPGTFSVTTTGFPVSTLTATGALPAGVTFVDNGNGTGTLAGTPGVTAGGTYAVTLQASNGVGAPVTQAFTLTVNAPPAFTSAAAATFTALTPGSFTIITTGHPATTISSTGALPTGVTFTNNGNGTATLAGTPGATTGGTYALSLSAANGVGAAATQNFVLTVNQAPSYTSATATAFQFGQAGTFTVTTLGFPVPTLSATGTLPTGVTFTPNSGGTATLAGTPTQAGTFPLVFSATNGVGTAVTQNFTLTVGTCPTISPAGGALPGGEAGTAYAQTISATGASGYTFAITSGALPSGVTLASGGTLSGTPASNASGDYAFSITVTAAGGCTDVGAYTLRVTPNAQAESYSNGVGNTQYSVGAGTPATPAVVVSGTVLTNDQGFGTLTAGPANIASTNGGQVTMSSNGTFLYTPPVGFAGPSDTFTYTLTDGHALTDSAVVTINLSGVVWYVNAATGAGDGRSNSPFNSMAAASTAAQTAQTIYVHAGSPAGATTLKASQTLRGAGEAFVLNGLTIAAATAPTLQDTLTLASGVAVRALTVNAVGTAIAGTGLTGTVGLTNVNIIGGTTGLSLSGGTAAFTATGGTISGIAPGSAVQVAGGSGTIAIGSTITSTVGRSVDVQSHTSSAVTFSGPISDTGTGVLLLGNIGSTIAFTGGLTLDTGANAAFSALGGGTVTATQNNTSIVNTITTTDGLAVQVVNTEIGAAGLTFRSITAGTSTPGPGNAIVLDNTGLAVGNGGLTVSGNGSGTLHSGGTIRSKTGADGSTVSGIGVYLNSTRNVALNWMHLFDFDNAAIYGRLVNGFTIANSLIDGTSGTNASLLEGPMVFGAPNPSGVNGLVGTGTFANTVVQGGVRHNLEFYNQTGTMALQLTGTTPSECQIVENSASTGGDGLHVLTEGTANATVTVNQCRFRANRQAGTRGLVTGDANLTVTITDSQWVQGAEGVLLSNGGNADLTATVTGGLFSDVPGRHIQVGQVPFDATAASMLRATLTTNTAYQANTVVPTAAAYSARLSSTVGQVAPARLLFDGNYIEGAGTFSHLVIETPDASTTPAVDVTVTNNRTDVMNSVSGLRGIDINGALSGAATNICAAVTGNLVLYPPDDTNYPAPAVNSIAVRQGNGTTVRLEQGVESLASSPTVVLQNNNNLGGVNSLPTIASGTVTVVANSTCLLPSAP